MNDPYAPPSTSANEEAFQKNLSWSVAGSAITAGHGTVLPPICLETGETDNLTQVVHALNLKNHAASSPAAKIGVVVITVVIALALYNHVSILAAIASIFIIPILTKKFLYSHIPSEKVYVSWFISREILQKRAPKQRLGMSLSVLGIFLIFTNVLLWGLPNGESSHLLEIPLFIFALSCFISGSLLTGAVNKFIPLLIEGQFFRFNTISPKALQLLSHSDIQSIQNQTEEGEAYDCYLYKFSLPILLQGIKGIGLKALITILKVFKTKSLVSKINSINKGYAIPKELLPKNLLALKEQFINSTQQEWNFQKCITTVSPDYSSRQYITPLLSSDKKTIANIIYTETAAPTVYQEVYEVNLRSYSKGGDCTLTTNQLIPPIYKNLGDVFVIKTKNYQELIQAHIARIPEQAMSLDDKTYKELLRKEEITKYELGFSEKLFSEKEKVENVIPYSDTEMETIRRVFLELFEQKPNEF